MTSQYEHDLWYEHGLRRAIQVLGGNEIASEYPAMAATKSLLSIQQRLQRKQSEHGGKTTT